MSVLDFWWKMIQICNSAASYAFIHEQGMTTGILEYIMSDPNSKQLQEEDHMTKIEKSKKVIQILLNIKVNIKRNI